jgi:hypothetical protein
MDDFLLNTVGTWALGLVQHNPAFASVLMFMGLLRLCIKPAMTILQAYVKFTPYDNDDKWLASLETSKGYKLAMYLLDWLLSVKVPEKK